MRIKRETQLQQTSTKTPCWPNSKYPAFSLRTFTAQENIQRENQYDIILKKEKARNTWVKRDTLLQHPSTEIRRGQNSNTQYSHLQHNSDKKKTTSAQKGNSRQILKQVVDAAYCW